MCGAIADMYTGTKLRAIGECGTSIYRQRRLPCSAFSYSTDFSTDVIKVGVQTRLLSRTYDKYSYV